MSCYLRLRSTVVGEKVNVRNCCADAKSCVSVNGLDVFSVTEVQTCSGIVDIKQRPSWVHSYDGVDAATLNVFAGDSRNVSSKAVTSQDQLREVQDAVFMEKVEELGKKGSNFENSVTGWYVVDGSGTSAPVN